MNEKFDVKLDSKIYYTDTSSENGFRIENYEETYKKFLDNPDSYWEEIANELTWIEKWDKVVEWNHPYAKWFLNSKLNITQNCLDRHIHGGRKNKVALIWLGDDGEERIFTYRQLYREVMKCANGLKSLGVKKGDTVCIYMPLVPEQLIVTLACARIGAIHSIVFAGFGMYALKSRIIDLKAKIVVTADASIRRGRRIELKSIVDEAVFNVPSIEKIVVLRRMKPLMELYSEMEIDYEAMLKDETECEAEVMDSEDPLFILYTSGTTGPAKGIVHTCAGYMVGTYYTTKKVFDIHDNDVYWCTADPGWITGHSYIIYGPLLAGGTVLITESTPDYPDPGIWWSIIEEFDVNIFYTAPTAIRMFMGKGDKWHSKYDLSSLRLLGSVGEPLNPEAFEWFYKAIGKERCPIVDTWWQTETGMHMITTLPGHPMKPGFVGRPIPGVVADVVDKEGNTVPPGQGGLLVIKEPWPSMMRTIKNNEEKYSQYWNTINGYYTVGDLAVKDEDGYIMILGRSDDVIIVSGHNIGSAEVESALVSNGAVAEAAVIGKPDVMKGNILKAFVILREGFSPSEKLKSELIYHVRMSLGPIAMPSEIDFVKSLPKTRSGKIMRRLLRAQELGLDPGDTSTLED